VPFLSAVCVAALAGCDGLLDVDVPDTITGEDLAAAANADLQVRSAIALFECGYSAFSWVALGHEGVLEPWTGLTSGTLVFTPTPLTGECDTTQQSGSWFDQIMGARAMISNARGTGVYDRLVGEWDFSTEERLSATAALYMAAALDHLLRGGVRRRRHAGAGRRAGDGRVLDQRSSAHPHRERG
jgi:hypothetical protein